MAQESDGNLTVKVVTSGRSSFAFTVVVTSMDITATSMPNRVSFYADVHTVAHASYPPLGNIILYRLQ